MGAASSIDILSTIEIISCLHPRREKPMGMGFGAASSNWQENTAPAHRRLMRTRIILGRSFDNIKGAIQRRERAGSFYL
jgi:hypothetical protein